MTFASRLKTAIDASGLSQAELARRCGMNKSSLTLLLSGQSREPRASNALCLARALGVRLPWLVNGELPITRTKVSADGTRLALLYDQLTDAEQREVEGYLAYLLDRRNDVKASPMAQLLGRLSNDT